MVLDINYALYLDEGNKKIYIGGCKIIRCVRLEELLNINYSKDTQTYSILLWIDIHQIIVDSVDELLNIVFITFLSFSDLCSFPRHIVPPVEYPILNSTGANLASRFEPWPRELIVRPNLRLLNLIWN